MNQDLCRLRIDTYPWTDSASFVATYKLSMDEFSDMYPSVEPDGYGFVGGNQYCVLMGTCVYLSSFQVLQLHLPIWLLLRLATSGMHH